ncbi:hypothetical protein C7974DRAFT_470670 [Boeremia exigua]|uniref:uncharacterized protein n=1 Tax=Boeremia exigua TaxID=749465 RepID=UPI001E8E712D|nr:uncharacterized protein C7974DRAFT_470670 [Boeremia exigua]KAH6637826.1 hypothetical protein C7974DRAFT_470670 [Boeremia exigua]
MVKLQLLSPFIGLALYPYASIATVIRSSSDCRNDLSCSFTQIESMTMTTRLDYVRTMQSDFFNSLNAGNQFAAIEGVIRFFINNDLGKPNSWASYVDAGIVEGIQNGGAITLGLHASDGSNPGTKLWAQFFQAMRINGYSNRDAHDEGWSTAEQTATDYGKKIADARFAASEQEKRWYLFSQLFRIIMRNHKETIDVCRVAALANPLTWAFAPKCDDLIKWLTNITDVEPTLCLSKTVWDLIDPNVKVLELPWVFGKILRELIECFEET